MDRVKRTWIFGWRFPEKTNVEATACKYMSRPSYASFNDTFYIGSGCIGNFSKPEKSQQRSA